MDNTATQRIKQAEARIAEELRSLHADTGLLPDSVYLNTNYVRHMGLPHSLGQWVLNAVSLTVRATL